ncbi:MAG: hypothetical protein OJF52_000721 [Nitrospira sp.]|jgi:hypothetical protein|nr:MAG: hypothetical protein OJF52_000721 [Nitrospira sp.]
MTWWYSMDRSLFITYNTEAIKKCPKLHLGGTSPAYNLASAKVGFPFTMTLHDYAAFLAISQTYLESRSMGGPIHCYHLGITVLMWHSTIWDYIGQFVNALCGHPFKESEVTFSQITASDTFKTLPLHHIDPIRESTLRHFVRKLRATWRQSYTSLQMRHFAAHRFHFANTFAHELDSLIAPNQKHSHANRTVGLRNKIQQSFDALIKAQQQIVSFLEMEEVKQWTPSWLKVIPSSEI